MAISVSWKRLAVARHRRLVFGWVYAATSIDNSQSCLIGGFQRLILAMSAKQAYNFTSLAGLIIRSVGD
jgi:hypothetical protein